MAPEKASLKGYQTVIKSAPLTEDVVIILFKYNNGNQQYGSYVTPFSLASLLMYFIFILVHMANFPLALNY